MRDLPTGPQLECLARECGARGIGEPHAMERFAASAMIERCRTIAAREAAAGGAALEPIRAALAALYGPGHDPAAQFAQLAEEIRSGALDAPGARRDRAIALLWALTLQKLRESNPRFLAAHGYGLDSV